MHTPRASRHGNCYEANCQLFIQATNDGYYAVLCHGVLTAPDYYKHMKIGKRFMHCWVEQYTDNGVRIHDNTMLPEWMNQADEYTCTSKEHFYDTLKPYAVVRMTREQVAMNIQRYRRYAGWDLHPDHAAFESSSRKVAHQ